MQHDAAHTATRLRVVVFTLNRSFYPTTSAVHPVSVLILYPRDTNYVVKDRKNKQKNGELIKLGKSNANVPDTRVQQTRLPRIRNTKNVKQIKQKQFSDKAEYKRHKYTYLMW